MFYLRNLKKLFKCSPALLINYFFMATFVCIVSLNISNITRRLSKISKNGVQAPFFHALVDKSQNFTRFSRKLKSLPGVRNVVILSPQKMEVEANKILGDLDITLSSEILNIGYAGLKVIFESGLKSESMELVRDYLGRLVGEQNVTIGGLVKSDNIIVKKGMMSFIFEYSTELIVVSTLFLWLLLNFFFARKFNNQMYLIQTFQRTKNIPIKMYAMNALLFLVVPLILFSIVSFSLLSFFVILASVVIGALPHLKRWQWISR